MNKINSTLFHQKTTNDDIGTCPRCQHALVIRKGKHGAFKACSSFPECDYSVPLHQHDGHIVKHMDIPCPVCGSELVLRQGRYGMFIGCIAFPSCGHIERRETEKETKEIACPECQKGQLQSRASRYGKTFYACTAYPDCRFLVNASPHSGTCQQCHYPLLVEKRLSGHLALMCASKKCGIKQD